jgi:hypothetical protein
MNLWRYPLERSACYWAKTAGILRDSVLHRYAQYCNIVRGRLPISQLKQSVSVHYPDSGGRGRGLKTPRSEWVYQCQINRLETALPIYLVCCRASLRGNCGVFTAPLAPNCQAIVWNAERLLLGERGQSATPIHHGQT